MSVVDAAMLGLGDCYVSPYLVSRIYYQRGRFDLNLGACYIDKLPLDVIRDYYGTLSSITSLCLEYNQISTLPCNFVSELRYIQVLDLGNNQLERLPDDFGKLDQLVYLDIHKNKLQSLPRSMCKMTRLTYLSLADNPFGPPLYDFVEKQRLNEDMNVTHIAQLVVKFLAKIPPETLTIIDTGSGDKPLVHRRAVTFENDNETREGTTTIKPQIELEVISAPITTTEPEDDSTPTISVKMTQSKESFETDLILGPFMAKTKPAHYKSSVRQRRLRQRHCAQVVLVSTEETWNRYKVYGAAILLVWLAMCPVMMALVFETSAVDQFAKEHDFLASLWQTYRPLHESVENGIRYIQVDNAIKVRGPKLVHKYHNVDPFTAMFLEFRKVLVEMFQSIVEYGQWK